MAKPTRVTESKTMGDTVRFYSPRLQSTNATVASVRVFVKVVMYSARPFRLRLMMAPVLDSTLQREEQNRLSVSIELRT